MSVRIPIKVEQREMRNATTILVAGATGNLGGRIVNSILREGAAEAPFHSALSRGPKTGFGEGNPTEE